MKNMVLCLSIKIPSLAQKADKNVFSISGKLLKFKFLFFPLVGVFDFCNQSLNSLLTHSLPPAKFADIEFIKF